MFAFLFGKPTAAKKVVPAETPSPKAALATLRYQEGKLEKRLEHVRSQMKALAERAKVSLTQNDKPKALQLLKEKAMLEEQEKSTQGMLDKIQQQRFALEMSLIQVDTVKAIQKTNTYFKEVEKEVDADKAQTIVDDMDEAMENANEVSRILSEPTTAQRKAQDEAEEQLRAMAAEMEAEKAPSVLPMPLPPTTLPVQTNKTVEEELAALERQAIAM